MPWSVDWGEDRETLGEAVQRGRSRPRRHEGQATGGRPVPAGDQLQHDRGRGLKCLVISYRNSDAAGKVNDVALFLFYFMKISFSVYLLFKWRQTVSARPRRINTYVLPAAITIPK